MRLYQDVLDNANHENGMKRINSLLDAFCDRCSEIKTDDCNTCNLKHRRLL